MEESPVSGGVPVVDYGNAEFSGCDPGNFRNREVEQVS